MLDPCYRNPAWVTNEVMGANGQGLPRWSARFRMPGEKAAALATAALVDAGAYRIACDVSNELFVEFDPVFVRRIVAVVVGHRGILMNGPSAARELDEGLALALDRTVAPSYVHAERQVHRQPSALTGLERRASRNYEPAGAELQAVARRLTSIQ